MTTTPPGTPASDLTPDVPAHPVMWLLAGHVPISLLVDLAEPIAPRSAEILVDEGAPEQHWWEPQGAACPEADAAPPGVDEADFGASSTGW